MKKEKKIYFKFLLFLLNIFLLTSCIFIKEDREGMKKVCDNVVDSCFSKNKDDIKKFFAPNIVEQVKNIDQEISDLQNYLTGDLTNYDYSYPGSEETSYSKGKKQVYITFGAFKVYSNETSYYFTFYYCSRDDSDENNVGVLNLLVQWTPKGDEEINTHNDWDEWSKGTKYRGITLI